MGKIKWKPAELSLRRSIILYITGFTLTALLLSGATANLCKREIQNIRDRYPSSGHKYYLTDEEGNRLGDGAYIGTVPEPLSRQDELRISVLEMIPAAAAPVYSALCILAAALLFYRNKLEEPLRELKTASEKISQNDLDFRVEYETADELGQLCQSFEIMRSTLAANFSEMWRQIEDRKQLNAAFSHELRTPLTVLKGYDEMLQSSSDRQTREIAATMGKHILRMEQYVVSMGNLRRLEDLQPEWENISVKELAAALYDSASMECRAHEKELTFQNSTHSAEVTADRNSILQVCGNLTANAARYAASEVRLHLEEMDGGILLRVADDGKGFSAEGLQKAVKPYFTEEKGSETHFGIGLYLCRMLCGHHDGWLKVENLSSGAQVTAFFKCR